jgi:hypothetical protein
LPRRLGFAPLLGELEKSAPLVMLVFAFVLDHFIVMLLAKSAFWGVAEVHGRTAGR